MDDMLGRTVCCRQRCMSHEEIEVVVHYKPERQEGDHARLVFHHEPERQGGDHAQLHQGLEDL